MVIIDECCKFKHVTYLIQVIGKGAFGKVMMVRMVGDKSRKVYAMKVRYLLGSSQ